MPYIPEERRREFDKFHVSKLAQEIENCGELNYVITHIILDYVFFHGEKYQSYNDILGALDGARLELYRRHIASYEDKKIAENGDV